MHKYKLILYPGFIEIDLYQLSMIPDTSGTGSENVLNIPGLLERLHVESQTWRGYKTSDQIRARFMAAVP
jgi:hypothetical protein